ncbi:MAG TPA: hypothetical protein VFH34_11900, partial [Anaerolineales bacterium]|nr:hypothetical protein [Anaerolineales bacterium]
MNFRGIYRTASVLVLLLVVACTSETPIVTVTAQGTLEATPALTVEVTAGVTQQATLSSVATGNCTRGDYFDQIESGGQTRQYLFHVPATYK